MQYLKTLWFFFLISQKQVQHSKGESEMTLLGQSQLQPKLETFKSYEIDE